MSAPRGTGRATPKRVIGLCAGFSDAWMTDPSTRCDGRRPRSAKARNRGKVRRRRCNRLYGDLTAVRIVALGRRGQSGCWALLQTFAVRLDDRNGDRAMNWRGRLRVG